MKRSVGWDQVREMRSGGSTIEMDAAKGREGCVKMSAKLNIKTHTARAILWYRLSQRAGRSLLDAISATNKSPVSEPKALRLKIYSP